MRTKFKKQLFYKIFSTKSHGAFGECHCGLMNYDGENYWDDDHEETMKRVNNLPDVFIQPNAIEFIEINGCLYVIGCKCKTDEVLFAMLDEHREQTLTWLKETEETINAKDIS